MDAFSSMHQVLAFVTCLLILLGGTGAFPSGAPLSACTHLLPVHTDGEQQTSASPYVLILNQTSYGDQPLKLTVSAIGSEVNQFLAFMLQAKTESGQSVGHFSAVPPASKTMTCYEEADTLTHSAAFIRAGMEVLWHPPNKNVGRVSIKGSVALNKVQFWAVESNALTGPGEPTGSGPSGPRQPMGNNVNQGGNGSGSIGLTTTSLFLQAVLIYLLKLLWLH